MKLPMRARFIVPARDSALRTDARGLLSIAHQKARNLDVDLLARKRAKKILSARTQAVVLVRAWVQSAPGAPLTAADIEALAVEAVRAAILQTEDCAKPAAEAFRVAAAPVRSRWAASRLADQLLPADPTLSPGRGRL